MPESESAGQQQKQGQWALLARKQAPHPTRPVPAGQQQMQGQRARLARKQAPHPTRPVPAGQQQMQGQRARLARKQAPHPTRPESVPDSIQGRQRQIRRLAPEREQVRE
ncbi:MAG: hypothetical protein JNK37_05595 [Verrucomicrobiales bacterium]|nr:hypothetical protein [Verrucomicrobiales bacterium]